MGTFTNFPYGVTSFGTPLPDGPYWPTFGQGVLFVDGNQGSDGQDGSSPSFAFKTMGRAFTFVKSGMTIVLAGQVREQLIAPLGVSDVVILGAGTLPRYGNEGSFANPLLDKAATWRPPAAPVAVTPLLVLRQQGWRFANLLIVPPTDAAGIQLRRQEDAVYPDPSHASFYGCRFSDGATGIQDVGGTNDVVVQSCLFQRHTARSIYSSSQAIALPLQWTIQNNFFEDVAGGIIVPGSNCVIQNNLFLPGATNNYANGVINTSGGAKNFVINNYTYKAAANVNPAGGFTGAATDVWRTYPIDTADPVVVSPPA